MVWEFSSFNFKVKIRLLGNVVWLFNFHWLPFKSPLKNIYLYTAIKIQRIYQKYFTKTKKDKHIYCNFTRLTPIKIVFFTCSCIHDGGCIQILSFQLHFLVSISTSIWKSKSRKKEFDKACYSYVDAAVSGTQALCSTSFRYIHLLKK